MRTAIGICMASQTPAAMHRVVMLDRDIIFARVAYLGGSEGPLSRAARFWRREHVRARLGGGYGFVALGVNVRDVRFFVIFHAHQ